MIPHHSSAKLKHLLTRDRTLDIALVGGALLLRVAFLALKPPHFDEGVNGWFVDRLTATARFEYDPTNYHGPLHFYVLFLFQALFGRNLWALRLPVAIVSTLAVWLMLRFDRFLPRRTTRFAALALAVSPAAVFYGRYSIHESWLVLFLLLTAWGIAGLRQFGHPRWLWPAILGPAGLILTKETYTVHAVCALLALPLLRLFARRRPSLPLPPAKPAWRFRDAAAPAAVAAGLILFFYSANCYDFSSLGGLYRAFGAWAETGASGQGHEKPWYYWLQLLARYEWPALIGLLLCFRAPFRECHPLLRFFAIYGVGTFAAYSLIPYKTPWCLIAIHWPFLFLFGDGGRRLLAAVGRRAGYSYLGILLAASAAASVRLNFFACTDEREPYVYVQSYDGLWKITRPLERLARLDPTAYHLTGHVIVPSYYPLPWMLGDFTRIGYYDEGKLPDPVDADFLVVEEGQLAAVEERLGQAYFVEPVRIRDSLGPARLFLSANTFRPLFPNRPADFPRLP